MDLKVASASATDVERAAVDSLLGPAPDDRARRSSRSLPTTSSPAAARRSREQRHLLLPALHAVNDRVGWISRGAINYIAQRLDVAPAEIYGVASSTRCSRSTSGRRARCTCASTWRAAPPAGSPSTTSRRAPTRRRASGCASGRRRRCVIEAGRSATPRVVRAGDAGRGAPHRRWRVARRRGARASPRSRRSPTTTSRSCCCARRRGRSDQPRRLPSDGGYEALRRAFALGPDRA